jgi:hypothetical protein
MNTQPPASSEDPGQPALRRVRGRAAADRDDHPVGLIRGRGILLALQCTSALIVKPLARGEVIVGLMSVSLTEQQVRERRKTVTRRLGWKDLRASEQLMLCRNVMGLRPGERIVRMTPAQGCKIPGSVLPGSAVGKILGPLRQWYIRPPEKSALRTAQEFESTSHTHPGRGSFLLKWRRRIWTY